MAYPAEYPAQVPVVNPTVELDVFPPQQHTRWTILLRLLLVIPHLIVLWALSIAAFVVVVCGWFGALFTGRLPQWCGDYLRSYLAWAARVHGYTMMLVDDYPPFTLNIAADYPIRMLFPAPTELNRLAVLFRLILAFPIIVLTGWLSSGWAVVSFVLWLIVLITGRMPQAAFDASAAVLRAEMRTGAYVYMLTPTYLSGIFGDPMALPTVEPGAVRATEYGAPQAEPVRYSATRPLWMSQGGRILLIVMLVLGIVSSFFQRDTYDYDDNDNAVSTSRLETKVADEYTDDTGRRSAVVSCPDELPARYGASVSCTVHDSGSDIPATVTVDEVSDGAVRFDVTIGTN
ncbi:DUF4389 domain-containing protein [Nocardia jejuensis]|uniref:DUF4389 domain-containing protein n=1 Tax=Nocardia jejuensis TaxID=328049 RepID=UPI00082C0C67|nr:DUF4389 domain-containing protein [Nocardia jejuensis]